MAVLPEGGNSYDSSVRRTGHRAGDGGFAVQGYPAGVQVWAEDGWAPRAALGALFKYGREHECAADRRAANLSELP